MIRNPQQASPLLPANIPNPHLPVCDAVTMVTGINYTADRWPGTQIPPTGSDLHSLLIEEEGGDSQEKGGGVRAGFPRTKCKFPCAKLLLPLLLCLVYKVFFARGIFPACAPKSFLIDDQESFSFFPPTVKCGFMLFRKGGLFRIDGGFFVLQRPYRPTNIFLSLKGKGGRELFFTGNKDLIFFLSPPVS